MKKAPLALLALLFATGPAAAAELTLTFRDGKVSIDAKDVTIRQILSEWARVGKTRIVNIERVASPAVTLRLDGMPEKQALEVILRAVPGYMAAPRPAPLAGTSAYDRILILATTTVAPSTRPPAQTSLQPSTPSFQPPSPLRPGMPGLNPGALPDNDTFPDRSDVDEDEDVAEALDAARAAAAAGRVAVPGMQPGLFEPGISPAPEANPSPLRAPVGPPGSETVPVPPPTNPWNAPAGTSTLAPPTPVPQPTARPATPVRPVQPDR